jgi:hypothetical protein
LPVLLLLGWARAGTLGHAIFLTFAAAMIVLDAYLTDEPGRSGDSAFDRDVADLESWLHDRGFDVQLREGGTVPVEVKFDRPQGGECPVGVMTGGAGRRCCAGLVPCGRKAERE